MSGTQLRIGNTIFTLAAVAQCRGRLGRTELQSIIGSSVVTCARKETGANHLCTAHGRDLAAEAVRAGVAVPRGRDYVDVLYEARAAGRACPTE